MAAFRFRCFPAAPGFGAVLLGLLLSGCVKEPTETWPLGPPLPETVAFSQAGLYPEGVESAGNAGFLVSSETAGAIGQVKDDGTYSVFADNPALVSTVGLRIDENRSRLLAAVSDPGYNAARTTAATRGKLARLAVFSLLNAQGTPSVVDLGGVGVAANYPNHFANDVALDADGNAYVTDSFAPVIYKVSPNLVVSVFAENPLFSAPAGMFGLNGIVWHPDGYLLVAKSNTGTLYKIPVVSPAAVSTVNLGSQNLQGADGLLLLGNELQVVCNAQARVFRLTTADGWANAAVAGTYSAPPLYPTTLAVRRQIPGADVASYVLCSSLNALQAGQTPPVEKFIITRVKF
ncbi:gluconolaconase [Hymenobacter ruricola]|uniref:Gluconolaconase n=1 Tax=Hymenobacter ruricola TaxID=2791023 RepID=A0ABS0I235_9BACT|nr:gluconolaconase [Hymenobacter ruricola]MBF9221007.1 gluconolaconase [Hymenobacter ruricola]